MIWVIGGSRFERAFKDFYSHIVQTADAEYMRIARETNTLKELQGQVAKLEVTKSQIEEKYNKREREIEHKLGLERQRQEQELALSIRDAKLKVKEENLELDRKRFEEQMKFTTDRFTTETGYLKDMIKPLLEALPKMKISQEIKSGV